MSGLEHLKQERPIVEELARRGHRHVSKFGRQVTFRCPFPDHEDTEPSFVVYTDTNTFRCYGSCGRHGSVLDLVMGLEAVELKEAVRILGGNVHDLNSHNDATPRKRADNEPPVSPPVKAVTPLHLGGGITLEQLGAAKKLETSFLESLGCRNSKRNGVAHVTIPYYSETGETLSVRSRLAPTGGRFRWRAGDKVHLYGLDRLDSAHERGWVLLVEGESDCWTCWQHGLPALGIPGKTTWRSEWVAKLAGLDTYVWREPDAEDLVERMAPDLPNLRVIVAPQGTKDLSEAHLAGQDVVALIDQLRARAPRASEVLRERLDGELADVMERARAVLEATDPLELVSSAIRAQGYGGDLKPAELTYIACTGRVLAMRRGSMPAHLLLLGPASAGKSFTKNIALRLMPQEAYHEIDAGSPRVLIYDDAPLEHRVLVFGEADSLPAGEDNPAASAVRNLCQDHHLHYKVTVRDAETGDYIVRDVRKPGPTTLVTTAVRRLGPQLDTRLFILEVPDDQSQIGSALRAQAALELQGGIPDPDPALIAYQLYLQLRAPWDVVVPFADQLAEHIARQPMESRVVRDYARLLTLIKAVAVLRHHHRQRDERSRLVAEPADYIKVYELVGEVYKASATGASRGVREAVEAASELLMEQQAPVTVSQIAAQRGWSKMAASRRVAAALKGGWLTNSETRRGYPYHLGIGEPLPSETGLLPPESLRCNTVTVATAEKTLV